VAAWRTGPLQHGAPADDCRRGRGHSQLQTNPAQGGRVSCNRGTPEGMPLLYSIKENRPPRTRGAETRAGARSDAIKPRSEPD
jgi:hypothetical protein